jgi:2-polyprenyl-6-methoxyphenol hydroxylase-like FAD-dependent oxidoreductase
MAITRLRPKDVLRRRVGPLLSLEELSRCRDFCFDKVCRIRMPSWTKGRVAIVGDAGYCASPAAGMGGSLAIVGAPTLADAFQKHHGNFEAAFQEYNDSLRPFVEDVQAQAVNFGLKMFVPRSEEALQRRNAHFASADFWSFIDPHKWDEQVLRRRRRLFP